MITNRRVLFIKEVEILGHMSVDWQCLFEDFVCPPGVSENLLKISVKVRKYESDLPSQRDRVSAFWLPTVPEADRVEGQGHLCASSF